MAARAKADTAAQSGQLNVRVTEEQAEGLATIDYLYGISPPELLRQLLNAELTRRREKDSQYNQALRVRREARLALRGDVHVLPQTGEVS